MFKHRTLFCELNVVTFVYLLTGVLYSVWYSTSSKIVCDI